MSQPIVDVGILTIRDDEFRAVLRVFADGHGIYKGRHREYTFTECRLVQICLVLAHR